MGEKALTAVQVAEMLGLSSRAVYLLAAPDGPLTCFRYGRAIRFDGASVRMYQRRQKTLIKGPIPDRDADLAELAARAVPLPPRCGVYFLFQQGRLVYVGQAINMARRIGQHTHDKAFDSYSYIECPQAELNAVEQTYIQRFRPPLNVQCMPPPEFVGPYDPSLILDDRP